MPTVPSRDGQEDNAWLGARHDPPDERTPGETRADLKAHLRDLSGDVTSGAWPGSRTMGAVTGA